MHPGASEYQQVRLLRQADAPGCIPTSYRPDIQTICVDNIYLTKNLGLAENNGIDEAKPYNN